MPAGALPRADFWRGKRVLLTGHTGFKGSWLALWLQRLGAQVSAIALPPATEPDLFGPARIAQTCDSSFIDIRDATAVAAAVRRTEPQIVLHLAAQALVRASYKAPLESFATNVMGTAHVLDALRAQGGVRVAVVVTTDKVYRQRGDDLSGVSPFVESDELGGHDPYSASKAASETVVASYRDAFLRAQGVAVASARAGNVIGGGDWSEDRLIPDAVRAWQAGSVLAIRNPHATRPWQHVLEPLAGYLRLAECLWHDATLAGAYNFGPRTDEAATVGDVITLARQTYGRGEWRNEAQAGAPHEAGWLALDVARARERLGVSPRWSLNEGVLRTMNWYRRFAEGADARALCEADIAAFEAAR
ncbi:MAG: CDP-glucose 4,6-dehydratase [Methylibium sp. NZG]|nr:MAG: CDP-glucose 4,6-dehydratase [Methylibium sp. NZG]